MGQVSGYALLVLIGVRPVRRAVTNLQNVASIAAVLLAVLGGGKQRNEIDPSGVIPSLNGGARTGVV